MHPLFALAATAATTRLLDRAIDKRKKELPALTVAPLLQLTSFLQRDHDLICLGTPDPADPVPATLATDPLLMKGLVLQDFENVFLEQAPEKQDALDAVAAGMEKEEDLAQLGARNGWLNQSREKHLAARLIKTIRETPLRFYAVGRDAETLKQETPSAVGWFLSPFALTGLGLRALFPRSNFAAKTVQAGADIAMLFSNSFGKALLDGEKTAYRIDQKMHKTYWTRLTHRPSLLLFNAEHLTNFAAAFGGTTLFDALRGEEHTPVAINLFSSPQQRDAFHMAMGDFYPQYRPAAVDYIAAETAEKTIIVFNDSALGASFGLYRPGKNVKARVRGVGGPS